MTDRVAPRAGGSDASLLPRLMAHLAWADAEALAALLAASEPPPQAINLYAHVLAAEHVWLRRIEGVEPTYEVWPRLSLEECGHLAARNAESLAALAGDAAGTARIVEYASSRGVAYSASVADILTHVALHGAYHRGQIALLVRASGGEPHATDYILWQRDA